MLNNLYVLLLCNEVPPWAYPELDEKYMKNNMSCYSTLSLTGIKMRFFSEVFIHLETHSLVSK